MCTFYLSLVPLTLASVNYVLSDVYAARQQQKYWKKYSEKILNSIYDEGNLHLNEC